MTDESHVPEVYARLGVTPVINAQSWVTMLGGSLMRPEVLRAMQEASTSFVEMNELNEAAGRVVARACGAEAGMVTSGAAAGNLLMAAACMTGLDDEAIDRLPDASGMKNEILLFKGARNHYDKSFETAGARMVEYGTDDEASTEDLESALGDQTAAVAWIEAPFMKYPFAIEDGIATANAAGVPFIVDAAAEVPPIENLTRYTKLGADMVTFSGGKGIGGPQDTGLLAASRDLIAAAMRNALSHGSPRAPIGRPAKVSKEAIAGLATALELFLESDHARTWAGWRARAEHIVDRLAGAPGLKVVLEDGDPNRQGPQAVIYFEDDWTGPSADEVRAALEQGSPPIYVGRGGYHGEINVVMVNVQPGEERVIADRLEALLSPQS